MVEVPKVKTYSERIAVMENEVQHIKESVARIEDSLTKLAENHIAHLSGQISEVSETNNKKYDLLKEEIRTMKEFCTKVQDGKKHSLSGKDKAIVYGSFITVIGLIVVEIIRSL